GPVTAKDLIPYYWMPSDHRLPMSHLLGVSQYFLHVMAATEPEGFECALERGCACPAKAGTDDSQGHGLARLQVMNSMFLACARTNWHAGLVFKAARGCSCC